MKINNIYHCDRCNRLLKPKSNDIEKCDTHYCSSICAFPNFKVKTADGKILTAQDFD